MSEDRSRGKYIFERIESIIIEKIKLLGNVLLDEVCQ